MLEGFYSNKGIFHDVNSLNDNALIYFYLIAIIGTLISFLYKDISAGMMQYNKL